MLFSSSCVSPAGAAAETLLQTITARADSRGLQTAERAGAVVSTVEAALFELLERAGTPEFKAVQKLII